MKVLVFDTETTGLPKDNSNIYRTDMWPHVLQLSYLMYDTNKNKILLTILISVFSFSSFESVLLDSLK